jgi:hypothetical protein
MEPKMFKDYTNSIFYTIDDNIYMEMILKNGYLWVNYNRVWSIFESKFGMEYEQIQDLIKGIVEEHFKSGSLTPKPVSRNIPDNVEEIFKK